ncbi:MAG: manganese efflux pump [Candidatus Methanomethylophilaceae archaeon]|nr:manganese efflux pump [Candidatus Methanomethylophilaceae archaeon]
MDIVSILLIAVGLAMDAFAVSLCKGTALRRVTFGSMLTVGLWFGVFQALMPIIGYHVGSLFYDQIAAYDHWVAFVLLAAIGANMIREALSGEEESVDDDLRPRTMLLLAIATSIDALAVGISLSMAGGGIWVPALVIGVVTMVLSMFGVRFGSALGDRFGRNAELLGGAVLIIMGLRILSDHLGFL